MPHQTKSRNRKFHNDKMPQKPLKILIQQITIKGDIRTDTESVCSRDIPYYFLALIKHVPLDPAQT